MSPLALLTVHHVNITSCKRQTRTFLGLQTAYSTCPVCGNTSVPTWFLEQHVSGCLDKPATQTATQSHAAATSSAHRDSKASKTPAARPPLHPQNTNSTAAAEQQDAAAAKRPHQLPQQTASAAQTAKSATVDGAVNAFAIMTAAAAAQVPLEAVMFLEACSDGSWQCHWWSAGWFPDYKKVKSSLFKPF